MKVMENNLQDRMQVCGFQAGDGELLEGNLHDCNSVAGRPLVGVGVIFIKEGTEARGGTGGDGGTAAGVDVVARS